MNRKINWIINEDPRDQQKQEKIVTQKEKPICYIDCYADGYIHYYDYPDRNTLIGNIDCYADGYIHYYDYPDRNTLIGNTSES